MISADLGSELGEPDCPDFSASHSIGPNERNCKGEESPYVRRAQDTFRAKAGESPPHIPTPSDSQIAENKPQCSQNPSPRCCRTPPCSPHVKANKNCTNNAQNNFFPYDGGDCMGRNHPSHRRVRNRSSDYCDG